MGGGGRKGASNEEAARDSSVLHLARESWILPFGETNSVGAVEGETVQCLPARGRSALLSLLNALTFSGEKDHYYCYRYHLLGAAPAQLRNCCENIQRLDSKPSFIRSALCAALSHRYRQRGGNPTLAVMPLNSVPPAPLSSLAPASGAGILHPHYTSATLITTCSRAVILHLTVTMTAPPLRGLAGFLS
ncbi:hypothetical protein PAMP_001969 [Pampus punctatissimus]